MNQNPVTTEEVRIADVPIWLKPTLTVKQAAALTDIGEAKIYEMMKEDKAGHFSLHVGRKVLIKREAFLIYLNKTNRI